VKNLEITNRKAAHLYHLHQSFEAGIELTGSEVKSVKEGNANLSDAYCVVEGREVWLRNMHISEYKQSQDREFDPKRPRRLLLNRQEIRKIARKIAEKGFALIPYRIYQSDRGFIKLEVYVASGKKAFDKRETLREKDEKRDLERDFKHRI
jgi:SsrA-binding protein